MALPSFAGARPRTRCGVPARSPGAGAMDEEIEQAYARIAWWMQRGKVVPVLGAGVNLSDRPPGAGFLRGTYLPSGPELAHELAHLYPAIESYSLAEVSQYVAMLDGNAVLYDELHDVFDADYPLTRVHRMLAGLARLQRESPGARDCMLCVTTNYDDLLERAFREIDEPYDLLTYIAEGRDCGKFRHVTAEGEAVVVTRPNEYVDVHLDNRTVIAKVHGAVDRAAGLDSYVITEDHYIDYMTRADISALFPAMLAAKLRKSHFLFLGYSLRDWNMRVMLHRLWDEQEGRKYRSWAIQAEPTGIDRKAWDNRGVDILPVRLEEFVDAIRERVPTEQRGEP